MESSDLAMVAKLPELNATLAKLLASTTALAQLDVLAALDAGRTFGASEAVSVGIADAEFQAADGDNGEQD